MAEKNTHSILETIKKKLNKFDESSAKSSKISDVASEFEYIAPAKVEQVENKDNPEAISSESTSVENQQPQKDNVKVDVVESEISQPAVDQTMQEKIEQVDEIFEEEEIEDYEDEVDFGEEDQQQAPHPATSDFNFALQQENELSLEEELPKTEALEYHDLNLENELSLEEELPKTEALEDHDLNLDNKLNLPNEELISTPEIPEVDELNLDENHNFEALNLENKEILEQATLPAKEDINPPLATGSEVVMQSQSEGANVLNNQNTNKVEDSYDAELQALEKELEEQERKRKEAEVAKVASVSVNETDVVDDIELELEKELMGFAGSQNPPLVPVPNRVEPKVEAKVEPKIEVKKEEVVQELPSVELQAMPVIEEIEHHDIDIQDHHLDHTLDEIDLSDFESDHVTRPAVKNTVMPIENIEKKQFLRDSTIMQATDSIKKLVEAKNIVAGISNFSQSPALRELASEMLEPKLEKWLNDHLGQIVEEIVREEIKKIIPKD